MQAQVFKIHSDFYYVKNFEHETFTCKLRDVLKKQKIDIRVGDFVELSNDNQFICSLLPRKNCLNRPKVSNIDCALVVCALKEPELDLIQLNRYLTYLKFNNIEAAICFNKEDLIDDLENKKQEIRSIYEKLGYKLFFISAKDKLDLEDLKDFIKNKIITLCGMSGVGKSTLLNTFNSEINLRTSDVSSKTQKGCHTTRHCEIIECDDFKIMDTPGFSCLKFDFLLPEKLIELFEDINQFTNMCKYSDCMHNSENDSTCGVIQNLDKIDKSRYESYLMFLEESLEYKELISKRSIKNEAKNKTVGNRISVKISKEKEMFQEIHQNSKLKIGNKMNLVQYKNVIQKSLENYFEEYKKDSSYSSIIWDSMSYTTLLDGKRLRAIMCLEIAKSFGIETDKAMPLAAAMEIMHAYSLIHDDLPAMDNDDLRRGKPTNHKVFGEAIAILAGDALISFGAQLIIDKLETDAKTKLEIVNDYLKTAGALGIVAGQVADIQAENKEINFENLKYIHKFKTGALFKCSMVIGAKLAQVDDVVLKNIEKYADNFGILFQIYDDIIDYTLTTDEIGKTAGKDKNSNKLTYVSAYGLNEAKNIYNKLKKENYDILTKLNIKLNVFDEIYSLLDKRIK